MLTVSSAPILKDPKWIKDREDFSGGKWDAKTRDRARPDAVIAIRDACELLERTVLSDGRKWAMGSDEPGLVDIEGMRFSSVLSSQLFWRFRWVTRN